MAESVHDSRAWLDVRVSSQACWAHQLIRARIWTMPARHVAKRHPNNYSPNRNWIHPNRTSNRPEKDHASKENIRKTRLKPYQKTNAPKQQLMAGRNPETANQIQYRARTDRGEERTTTEENQFKQISPHKRKIATETEKKTKTKHWAELKDTIEPSKRPEYMNKLNRKQCNAIFKTRSSMLPVKNNQKSQYSTDLTCRFCRQQEENQEHILQDCTSVPGNDTKKLAYPEIFKDKDHKTLGKAADRIIEIIAILEETRT